MTQKFYYSRRRRRLSRVDDWFADDEIQDEEGIPMAVEQELRLLISQLGVRMTDTEANVTQLTTDLTKAKDSIDDNASAITDNSTDISANATAAAAAATAAATAQTGVNSLTSAVSSLEGRVDDVEDLPDVGVFIRDAGNPGTYYGSPAYDEDSNNWGITYFGGNNSGTRYFGVMRYPKATYYPSGASHPELVIQLRGLEVANNVTTVDGILNAITNNTKSAKTKFLTALGRYVEILGPAHGYVEYSDVSNMSSWEDVASGLIADSSGFGWQSTGVTKSGDIAIITKDSKKYAWGNIVIRHNIATAGRYTVANQIYVWSWFVT